MHRLLLRLRPAAPDDLGTILDLIDDAAAWLRDRGTDQWQRPWPDPDERNGRILTHLRAGKTWVAWDGNTAAATCSADLRHDPYWPENYRRDAAVYAHRLIVARAYKGYELGAALLNWIAAKARSQHGAQWIRVSAWTTNRNLHRYYLERGFEVCPAYGVPEGYPSAAFFQRPTALSSGPRPTALLSAEGLALPLN